MVVEYVELEAYRNQGFKGLWVQGCVERGEGSNIRPSAHTHFQPDDPYKGWICFKGFKRLRQANGKPTLLIWHELAHVLCGPQHWHDRVWQDMMRSLCGRVDQQRRATGARLRRRG